MNEILDNNFQDLHPKIETAIKNATFIAIDAEFTGIYSEENVKLSLFDSLSDRYITLKKNIEGFAIVQFGIAVFKHERDKNAYAAQCFNFYLFPRAVPFKNVQLSWQVTALEFLSTYKFDFNKFINNGISYLNEIDEQLLREQIKQCNLVQTGECLTYEEESNFKDCINRVSEWLENTLDQVSFKLEGLSPILQYMLHKEIRNTYKSVWTTSGYKSVDVIRVTRDIRALLQKEGDNRIEEELIQSYIGFSTVFKLLASSGKPIIGHNILLDLMFIHQQFYKPLPDEYEEFKTNIHKLLPQVYDTKHLSFQLQKLLGRYEANWRMNSLSSLYEYFTSVKGKRLTFNSPTVYLNGNTDGESYHSAAWDSYFAGYVFVKMSHMFSIQKFGSGLEEKDVTNSELMASVKEFANCINITRSNELYMQLDGPDPTMSRPEWLHVKLKLPTVGTKQLAEQLSPFGAVDIKPVSRRGVLVAVSTRNSALHILSHFQSSGEFQVARYNRLRHAPPGPICLWSGLTVAGSCLLAWIMKNMLFKSNK